MEFGITFWLLSLLCGLLGYWWIKLKNVYKYWERRGVAQTEPVMFFGDFSSLIFFRESVEDRLVEYYKKFHREQMFGFYSFVQPVLLIRDPLLIEQVLVKDFGSYVDHGYPVDDEANPLEISLVTMTGNKWRAVRNKMTPTFTTGKLRGMTSYMSGASRNTLDYLEGLRGSEASDVDMRDVFAMYATNIIGSCVFGLDTKDMAKKGSEFREMGTNLFKVTPLMFLKMVFIVVSPSLSKKLKLGFMNGRILRYFQGIILKTLDHRRKTGEKRKDFVQLLLQLQEKGSLEMFAKEKDADDDYLETKELQTSETFEITDSLVVSQAMSFLTAGFESISLVMMFCCFELAQNEEVQERLREEVRETLAQHGSMTYQAVKEMTYLEQCLQETLRMYPVGQSLMRQATRATTLGGVEIEKDTKIMISLKALHYDPQYYPNPQVFDPDRFHPTASRTPFTYLPFGDGPRVCIGMRFALLEMKIGIASLLNEYKIKLSPKVKLPLKFALFNFLLTPKENILFQLTKL